MPVARESKAPGLTDIPPQSVATDNSGWRRSPSQAISWTAQGRLGKRVRHLLARGKHANQVVVALARELAGLLWAIANQGPVTPEVNKMARYENHNAAGLPPAEEAQPRCGATLDGVPRPVGILVPRGRPAPDGGKYGGTNPRLAAGSPGGLTGAGSSAGPLHPEDINRKNTAWEFLRRLLTSEVISTPKLQRRGLTHHRLPPVPPRRKPPLSPRPRQAVVRRRSGRPCGLGCCHHLESGPYDACNKACMTSWGNSIKMK
jgi:hypothetical protein